MWRTILRVLIIGVTGSGVGLLVNGVSPRGIPYRTPPITKPAPAQVVSLPEAIDLWKSGSAFFLDARQPADYARGHIAQAFNLPEESFDERFDQIATMLTPESPIVVYCDGPECDLSHRLAEKLREAGYKKVRILVNGWTVWRTAAQPVTRGDRP